MREQFEKLPAIKRAMKDGPVEWDDGDGCYGGDDDYCSGYVNGAWYAYQEQQKIIDMQECGATEIQMILDDNEYNDATKLERIKELLK